MRWLDAVAGSKLAANLAAQKLLRRPEVVGFLVLAGGSKSRRPEVANTIKFEICVIFTGKKL